MDLIYEGITTVLRASLWSSSTVRMDLIYEGITTQDLADIFTLGVRMDLIYEGITTS